MRTIKIPLNTWFNHKLENRYWNSLQKRNRMQQSKIVDRSDEYEKFDILDHLTSEQLEYVLDNRHWWGHACDNCPLFWAFDDIDMYITDELEITVKITGLKEKEIVNSPIRWKAKRFLDSYDGCEMDKDDLVTEISRRIGMREEIYGYV